MGVDRDYQAFPHDAELFGMLKATVEFDGVFGSLPALVQKRIRFDYSTLNRPEFILCQNIVDRTKGLETRCFGARSYDEDELMYLLSGKRRSMTDRVLAKSYFRKNPRTRDGLFWRIIEGADEIAPNLQSSIGRPIRYMYPEETTAAADILEPIGEAELREHFIPEAMIKADAIFDFYSGYPESSSWEAREFYDKEFQFLAWFFAGIKSVYIEAALHNEGVFFIEN